MNETMQTLQVLISDSGYDVITNTGGASYNLDGVATVKIGLFEHLPNKLMITDVRKAIAKPEPSDQLSEAVQEEIRQALRPGGLLHGR